MGVAAASRKKAVGVSDNDTVCELPADQSISAEFTMAAQGILKQGFLVKKVSFYNTGIATDLKLFS